MKNFTQRKMYTFGQQKGSIEAERTWVCQLAFFLVKGIAATPVHPVLKLGDGVAERKNNTTIFSFAHDPKLSEIEFWTCRLREGMGQDWTNGRWKREAKGGMRRVKGKK